MSMKTMELMDLEDVMAEANPCLVAAVFEKWKRDQVIELGLSLGGVNVLARDTSWLNQEMQNQFINQKRTMVFAITPELALVVKDDRLSIENEAGILHRVDCNYLCLCSVVLVETAPECMNCYINGSFKNSQTGQIFNTIKLDLGQVDDLDPNIAFEQYLAVEHCFNQQYRQSCGL